MTSFHSDPLGALASRPGAASPAPPATHCGASRSRPRDDARARRPRPAALRRSRRRRAPARCRRCRASTSSRSISSRARRVELAALGVKAVLLFGIPDCEGPARPREPRRRRRRAAGDRGAQGRAPRPRRHDRRLPLRVHGSRPLRAARRRRLRAERRDAGGPRGASRSRTARPAPTSSRRAG